MAALGAQTVASSYEQLLHVDTDGGGNGNNLLSIKDGDNGTTFGLKLATNKVEVIPGSDDANAFEVSKADGTAVLTVNTSTVGATLNGDLSVISSSSGGGPTLTIKNTNDDAEPTYLKFVKDTSTSAADNDEIVKIEFYHDDDGDNQTRYGAMIVSTTDTATSSEDTKIKFMTRANATDTETLTLESGKVGIGTSSPTYLLDVEASSGGNLSYEDAGEGLLSLITSGGTAVVRLDARSGEHHYLTNGGNLGIGHATPQYGLTLAQGTADANKIGWEAGDNVKRGSIHVDGSSDDMHFQVGTSNNEKMRILNEGGITFNGDTAAANALDDYEEGTATVAFTAGSGSITIGSSQMQDKLTYVKIGGVVHFKGRFTVSAISSPSSELGLSGLPFTSANPAGDAAQVFTVYFENAVSAIGTDIIGILGDGQTACSIRRSGDTDGGGTLANMVDTGTVIIITGTYFVVAP
jgi:hypothetical protein